jgi:RNA polymerase sigma-70 factor (ECF subfamily)
MAMVLPQLIYVIGINRAHNMGGLMQSHFDADNEVIARVLGGDVSAYSFIVQKYRVPLFRLGLKLIGNLSQVDDILQDTFIKAYKSLDKFQGRSSFKSWLYQIFMNTLRNSLRGRPILPIDKLHIHIDFDGDQSIQRKQVAELIETVIKKLPPKQQMAVSLRIYEDLSFEEISNIMNCPYDTAKANFRHGLLKLKNLLEGIREMIPQEETSERHTFHFQYKIEEVEL